MALTTVQLEERLLVLEEIISDLINIVNEKLVPKTTLNALDSVRQVALEDIVNRLTSAESAIQVLQDALVLVE